MENTLKLSIVTPNGVIFEDDVKSVVLPGKDGEFGVMPSHSSLVTTLDVGVIDIVNKDSSKDVIAINWGYAKVNEKYVRILVDGAVSLDLNSSSDIAQNIKKAEELVNSVKDSNVSLNTVTSKIYSHQ